MNWQQWQRLAGPIVQIIAQVVEQFVERTLTEVGRMFLCRPGSQHMHDDLIGTDLQAVALIEANGSV
ncbi:hypothetical protein D9M73_257970 [compost metagenome]